MCHVLTETSAEVVIVHQEKITKVGLQKILYYNDRAFFILTFNTYQLIMSVDIKLLG